MPSSTSFRPVLTPRARAVLSALIEANQGLTAAELVDRLEHLRLDVFEVADELERLKALSWVVERTDSPSDFLSAIYCFEPSAGLVVDSPCGRRWFVPQAVVAQQVKGDPSRLAWTDVEREGVQLKDATPEQIRRALDAIRSASGQRPHQVARR